MTGLYLGHFVEEFHIEHLPVSYSRHIRGRKHEYDRESNRVK